MNNTIKYPTLDEIKCALFIQPHPDDNEIGAGGTIALLRKHGVVVYVLTITKGEGGSHDTQITSEQITSIRLSEAKEAMRRLEIIDVGNLMYEEMATIDHDALVNDIVSILRKLRVDAVFTVDPHLKNELHPTHLQVGKAVEEAFMRCGVIHYPNDHRIHPDAYDVKMIGYYMSDEATTMVNISEVMEQKIAAIQAHKSQIDDVLLAGIYGLAESNAFGYDFMYAEPIKLCGALHTHCFAIPSYIRRLQAITIYE